MTNILHLATKSVLLFLDNFMTLASNFHPTIKFSVIGDANQTPFLDTIIYRGRNNYILTRLCNKPTNNKYYQHYHSAHPWKQKKNAPYGLLIRCKGICSEDRHFEEKANVIIKKKLKMKKYPNHLLQEAYNKVKNNEKTYITETYNEEEDK